MSEGSPVAGSLRFMLQCNQHEIPSEGDVLQKIKTSKRDGKNHQIWTEEAILALLDAYEDKWRFLDRGSLRRKHWEEVATAVSLRGEGKWSFRTGTQCKNKIEHLKKKYRSKKASNNACATKWVFFNHMDQMLSMAYRGTTASQLAGVPELLQYGNYAEFYHKADKLAPKSLSDDADNGKIISFGIAGTKNESAPNIDMLKCCCIDSDSEFKRQKTLHDQTGRRVEMERTHNEMEYRRTEMMLTTQLQIAKLLTTGNRKRKV
ncbi:hypothetical protein O6H91_Y198600 [Diphasiastrum complanatum]|nr:hypothetical protein O6H91_Y198600 [Diphasiastrum complanatum]